MGNGNWNSQDWNDHTTRTRTKSQDDIFRQNLKREIHPDLNPALIDVREAVASAANPRPTPIIIGCDETGSMGHLAELAIKEWLGKIMGSIYEHKPVSDPQIMCAGIGDLNSDRAPLQVTQFEAEVKPLTEQVAKIYIEKNGGSNGGESYPMLWWFASFKTRCDEIIAGRKGYIFTIGDECPHMTIKREHILKFGGLGAEADVDVKSLLEFTQRFWHVFHLIVRPFASQPVVQTWERLLGDHAIFVEDHSKIAEVITAIIQITNGQTVEHADKQTALVVRNATSKLAITK